MSSQEKSQSREWLLLSAYVDGQLSERETRKVEELLQRNLAIRDALERLQRIKSLLKNLPSRPVPRNFIVSPHPIRKSFIPSLAGVLRYSSAAAGLLLLIVLALDFMPGLRPEISAKGFEVEQPEMLAAEAREPDGGEPPAIIFWGSGPPAMGVYGKGGGGGDGYGSAAGESYGIGGGDEQGFAPPALLPETQVHPPDAVPEETTSQEKPANEETLPKADEEDLTVEKPPLLEAAKPESGFGESPILGVRPEDEQGTIQSIQELPRRSFPLETELPLRFLEIILGVLVVVTAVPAWLLMKRSRQVR